MDPFAAAESDMTSFLIHIASLATENVLGPRTKYGLDEITNRIYEVDSSLTIRPTGF
jgi:hypothetical protein